MKVTSLQYHMEDRLVKMLDMMIARMSDTRRKDNALIVEDAIGKAFLPSWEQIKEKIMSNKSNLSNMSNMSIMSKPLNYGIGMDALDSLDIKVMDIQIEKTLKKLILDDPKNQAPAIFREIKQQTKASDNQINDVEERLIGENKLLVGIGLSLNGLFTGVGSAVGNYLANRHIIKHVETLQTIIQNSKGAKNE